MDLPLIITGVLAACGTGGAITQVVALIRERHRGAPLDETQARLDIVRQLETEKSTRASIERERDAANSRAAAEGRRADTAERTSDQWERYSAELREDCLSHGTDQKLLRPRPQTERPTP